MTVAARSWLFVPGSRPERFAKAAAAGAGAVILDLEDAVATEQKDDARAAVASWLAGEGHGWVRINGAETDWHDSDVQRLRGLARLDGLVVPKSQDGSRLAQLRALVERPVVALVETAVGIDQVRGIARGVDRLALGSIDLALDLDAEESRESLLLARTTLVLASRVAGLPGPIDGVTTAIDDAEILDSDTRYARSLGFAGKLCIHPRQVTGVEAAFAPSAADVAWAQRVLDADDGSGAAALDGAMIDKPVRDRARRILGASRS